MKTPIFPMVYEINSGSIPATTGTTSVTQVFSSTKDFKLNLIRATGGSGIKVQIAEVSGRTYSNVPITTANIGNNQNNGVPMFDNVIIPRGTQLVFNFSNTSGGALTEVLQLWGVEID